VKNAFDLNGRVALVTGSTRGGIGAALADALEGAGAMVWRHGHPAEPQADAIPCDLLEPDAPRRLLSRIPGPAPDLLVCNAGGFFDAPFLQVNQEMFAKRCS